jgi:glycosyltransferase involved in cell wall biosynthesis
VSSISFIVPTYNEIDNLGACVQALEEYSRAHSHEFEIIVIDSGSTDGTRELLEQMRKEKDCIRAVFQDKRMGMGWALREAYEYVQNPLVCHYECDMPFELVEIEKALELLATQDCDFVLGQRIGGRDRWARVLYTLGYRIFLRIVFGARFQTINYSFKVFDSKILNCISLKSSGWFIDAELILESIRCGFRIRELPVPYLEREKGASTVRFQDIAHIISEAGCYARERWSYFSPFSS